MDNQFKEKLNDFCFLLKLISKRSIRRLKDQWRRKHGKHVSLAVVGSMASGKSFLLKDIITSLGSMGDSANFLVRDGFRYKNAYDYTPNELGGHGRTPFYVCRQSNLYGAKMEFVGNSKVRYDLDFLNIPGEAFSKAYPEDLISRVGAYNQLREKLQTPRNLFIVTTYVEEETGDIKQIVEPKSRPVSSGGVARSTKEIDDNVRFDRFLTWEEIAKGLDGYKLVKGATRKINGKKLLDRFFEYDTDSVIRSIEDVMNEEIEDLSFDKTDFEKKRYDKAFVFLHYCSKATDIVVCDRIFMPTKEDNARDIPFGELTNGISQFIEENNICPQVYLAFRNVDFMLYEKEQAYIKLNNVLDKLNMDVEQRRNAIYSIFHSAVLYHVNNNLNINDEFEYFVGLDGLKGLRREDILPCVEENGDFLQKIAEYYVDFNVDTDIIVQDTNDLAEHINSRLGGEGNAMAFRGLLQKTRVDARNKDIVPHVYFTCTPVTDDYEIYKNYLIEQEKNKLMTAPDFKREETGQDGKVRISYFMNQNSHACFGSYQLCMDIMKHHKLKQFSHGSLLRCLQGL